MAARARRTSSSTTVLDAAAGFTATVILVSPLGHLLRAHVLALDAGDGHRFLHGVAAERLAQLLVENHLDESGDAFFLRLARLTQRVGELLLRACDDALEAAAFRHLGVGEMRIELGADEVVVVPEDRVALLRAPLIVAEHHHGDAGIFLAADRAHLAHGDADGAVAGKPDDRRVRIADLGADDRREAGAGRTEQAGRQIFAGLLERRIGVADGAVVADVAGDDGVLRQACLDRAPGLARRHAVGVALARVGVPGRARIVLLVIHAGERLQPARLGGVDQRLALLAARIAGRWREFLEDRLGDELGVAANADGNRLGQ